MLHLLALLGVLSISFSAVFVRLAGVSPVTADFYRAACAVPVLAVIRMWTGGRDVRTARSRALAFASGIFLGIDLALWHQSIALIGVGLGTVLPNVQVVFVALAAAVLYRERLTARTVATVVAMLGGIVMTSGLARSDAFGAAPAAGVVFGVLAGISYSVFLLMFRASNRALAPTPAPLLDATLGTVAGALLCVPFDPGFSFAVTWAAAAWLVLLALVAQVLGWLCIATALPRLPATETSIVLLVQPVFALIWGTVIFAERLSTIQWSGSALVLIGVGAIAHERAMKSEG